jgi:hypothetical protein
MTAFAIVLILGAAAGWIAAEAAQRHLRWYLRLSAMLYAAMAVSAAMAFAASAVTQIVATLGAPLLATAACGTFRRVPPTPVAATIILATTCVAGIAAAATGTAFLSTLPQVLAAVAILATARRVTIKRSRLYLALGAVSLLGAAACQLIDGTVAGAGQLLFSAAGLLGVALGSDVLVEQRQKDEGRLAVRRAR